MKNRSNLACAGLSLAVLMLAACASTAETKASVSADTPVGSASVDAGASGATSATSSSSSSTAPQDQASNGSGNP